jgi:hypothetical protein
MLLIYLLGRLGMIDRKQITVRGFRKFAIYSLAGLFLFIVGVVVVSYVGLVN